MVHQQTDFIGNNSLTVSVHSDILDSRFVLMTEHSGHFAYTFAMTTAQARELASALIAAADEAEGGAA